MDEISGKKKTIKTTFGKSYFWVSDEDIMLTIPCENFPKHVELRVTTEAICRLASKGMKARLSMDDVIAQFRKSDGGRNTILKDLADGMAEYLDMAK
jgi:hypothetical protein